MNAEYPTTGPSFRERLTPPAPETRTPSEHYAIADRLLRELDNMQVHDLTLPAGVAKSTLVMLHARLAQCEIPNVQVINNHHTAEGN